MNQIDLSIWGIRRGFEKDGIFHTHDIKAVRALQTDRFRNLSNSIGNKGFYILQHRQGKTIISFVDTSIREFLPTGARPGYVVFSLIIDNRVAFTRSPRTFLHELANFYKTRVGEGDRNNFTTDEITSALASMSLIQNDQMSINENNHAYTYFTDASKLDSFLTGKVPFAAFGELALIPTEIDLATRKFKELAFIDESYGLRPQFIDIFEAELIFRKKQEDDREREILAQQEIKRKQEQTEIFSREISELIKLENTEELLQRYNSFEYKQLLDPQLIRLIQEQKEQYDKKAQNKLDSKREQELVQQCIRAYNANDIETAYIKYEQIKNKNSLIPSIQKSLQEYETKLAKDAQIESDRRRLIKKQAQKKSKIQKNILYSLFFLLIVGGVYSFLTETPGFLYQTEENNSDNDTTNESNKAGKKNQDTTNKSTLSAFDSLKAKFLNHESIASEDLQIIPDFISKFGIVYIQYSEKGDYRKAKTEPTLSKPESIIKDVKEIQFLNETFNLNVVIPQSENQNQLPIPAQQQQQQQTIHRQTRQEQPRQEQNSSAELPEFPLRYLNEAEELKKKINDNAVSSEEKKVAAERIKAIKKDYVSNVNKKWKENPKIHRKLTSCETVALTH
jgi:hypothetical protein